MRCLEIIELRSINSDREVLEAQLQKLMDVIGGEKKNQTIRLYRRVLLDSDLSIHLRHNSETAENIGSEMGFRLASALKAFGWVNHRMWIEM